MSFPDIMEAYALDPTAENLIELHRAIMAAPSYDPMVMIAGSVAPLAKAGEHQAIVDELWRRCPGPASPPPHTSTFPSPTPISPTPEQQAAYDEQMEEYRNQAVGIDARTAAYEQGSAPSVEEFKRIREKP